MKYGIARVLCSILVWLIVAAASVAEAAPTLAYVTNSGSNTISVIDTSTRTVVGTIVVGVAPAGIAVTPDGAFLYVANSGNDTVSVVDTAASGVVATIPVGVAPAAIAISADGSKVYVANSGSDSVSVVSTASNTVVATVSMGSLTFDPIYPVGPAGIPYSHMAVTADGARVYVTNTYPYNLPLSSSLKVIDTATNTVSVTVPLSERNSGSVELSPDGTVGYVTGWFGYLQTFSLATNAQTQAFSLSGGNSGISLAGIAVPPNSPFVYVAASEHNKVYRVDPVAQAWVGIAVGAYPTDVSITPDAAFAYVTNRTDSTVSVIDISSNTLIDTIAVGPNPSEVAFAPAVLGDSFTEMGPANFWLGLKTSDDIGTKFDLLAEILKNGVVVASGQLNGVPGGGSGFNNAILRSVSMAQSQPIDYGPADTLGVRLSVRIAEGVSGHRSGTARLWFDDAAADGTFAAVVNGVARTFHLRHGFVLDAAAGSGPKKTLDVRVDKAVGGNPFRPFGTWTIVF